MLEDYQSFKFAFKFETLLVTGEVNLKIKDFVKTF